MNLKHTSRKCIEKLHMYKNRATLSEYMRFYKKIQFHTSTGLIFIQAMLGTTSFHINIESCPFRIEDHRLLDAFRDSNCVNLRPAAVSNSRLLVLPTV